ncbi:MAG: hypothetical protein U0559_08035 [Anaerolineae bacterium]
MVKELVEAMGGSVGVESKLGEAMLLGEAATAMIERRYQPAGFTQDIHRDVRFVHRAVALCDKVATSPRLGRDSRPIY